MVFLQSFLYSTYFMQVIRDRIFSKLKGKLTGLFVAICVLFCNKDTLGMFDVKGIINLWTPFFSLDVHKIYAVIVFFINMSFIAFMNYINYLFHRIFKKACGIFIRGNPNHLNKFLMQVGAHVVYITIFMSFILFSAINGCQYNDGSIIYRILVILTCLITFYNSFAGYFTKLADVVHDMCDKKDCILNEKMSEVDNVGDRVGDLIISLLTFVLYTVLVFLLLSIVCPCKINHN